MFFKRALLQFVLIAALSLSLPGCAKSDVNVNQQESGSAGQENNQTTVVAIDDSKEEGTPAAEMTPSDKNNSAAEDANSIQEEGCLEEKPSGNKLVLQLVMKVKEISTEDFLEKYGEDFVSGDLVLAKAERIAEVDLNSKIFDIDYLSGVENLSLELFDNNSYPLLVDMLSSDGKTISLKGSSEASAVAVFFLSATEEQVLATLRLPESNYLYTIKHIYPSGKHYLFQGLITEVEQYECEVRIPPEHDSAN
jgi:hypothetical protein